MKGEDLRALISNPPPPPPFLIDQLLPENCCFMLTGETGKGKSVLAAQIAISLTSATPLFSTLSIPKPRSVYYIQFEGSFREQLERLHFMQSVVPIDTNLLEWDSNRRLTSEARYKRISTMFGVPPDLVVIDPIYKMTGGDIAKADEALKIVNFSDRLMELGCSVLLVHHPHRGKVTPFGREIEEDDAYYGHSFLKNHVEISYVFKQIGSSDDKGQLIRKKRREDNTLPVIQIIYHPETYTCSMTPISSNVSKRQLVIDFLKSVNGQGTSFKEVQKAADNIPPASLRRLQNELIKDGLLKITGNPGETSVWTPTFDRGVS